MLKDSKLLEPLIIKLFQRALSCPESIMFVFDGKAHRVNDIANEVISVSEYFKTIDLPQQFIILSMENSPAFLVAFLGGNMCNLNVGVFNELWPDVMVGEALKSLEPDCVVYDHKAPNSDVQSICVTSINQRAYKLDDYAQLAETLPREHNSEQAFYTGFTSGSSGVPKGFVRSGLSWCQSFEADKREFGFYDNDIFICPGSFAHSLFLYAALRAVYAGAQLVAYRHFRPDKVIHDIIKMSASVVFVVPTQLLALCELSVKKGCKLTAPRLVLSAGAKLSERVRRLAQETLPNAEVVEFYGSSEHGYISVSRETENPPPGSVGRAFNGVQINILDTDSQKLPAGKIGQVFVASPYMFSGYAPIKGQDSPSLPSLNGFTGTGDTGYLDDKGFLFLCGRTDRMIVCSGRNIYPESIEAVLLSIEGIRNAAVLSRFDKHRGQRLFAVVEFQEGWRRTRRELLECLKAVLPAYALPSVYLESNDWPLTVSHKTDFQRLKGQAESVLKELPA